LRILDIHIFGLRQIADRAGNNRVYLIFNRSCLSTVSDSQIALAVFRAERGKNNLGPFFGCDSAELRKLDVIADLDRDFAAVCVKDAYFVPPADAPPFSFIRGNMKLILLFDGSVPSELVSDIVDLSFFFNEVGTADNIDIVFNGKVCEQADIVFCIFGNPLNGQAR